MKKLFITTAIISILSSPALANDSNVAAELATLKAQIAAQQKLIDKLEKSLNTKIATQEKDIAKLKSAPAKTAPSGVTGDVKITMTPAPKIESTDGKFSFQPFGRLHLDTAVFQDDKSDHPDGSTFRRARIGFKGKVDEDVEYKAEFDFGNKSASENGSAFKDVYLAYTGLPAKIMVGSFKPALGLEELTSSNYTTFIERSLPTGAFVTGHIIGAQVYDGSDNYSWAIGVHNDLATTKSTDDEAKSVVGRATYAPIAEPGKVLHFGISEAYRVPDRASDSTTFSSAAENSIQSLKSVATGTIAGVESVSITGLEASSVYGPFSLQGEYFYTSVERESLYDLAFNGWYAQASWFLTGESRPYTAKSGLFDRVKPKNSFSVKDGGTGAWEVAARYSMLDLTDGSINGGKVKDITLGVNWYLNPNTRLMANYIISNKDNVASTGGGVAADDDPKVLLLRAAIDF